MKIKNREKDLERELAFHEAERARELEAAGIEREKAVRAARIQTGAGDGAKEACREVRRGHWLEDLGRDLLYGLRQWARQPGFAAIAILTLGLSVGGTTILYTMVERVVLRPVAFHAPENLVEVWERTSDKPNATALAEGWGQLWAFSYPNYRDLAQSSRTLMLGASRFDGAIVAEPGKPSYVNGAEISASLPPVLGVEPAAGRGFTEAEDAPGGAAVALVSTQLAAERFGGAARALGQRIEFDGELRTIVGVMPAGFDLTGYTTQDAEDVYIPLGQERSPGMANRGAHLGIHARARLRPGATIGEAQREMEVLASQMQRAYPKTNERRDFFVEPLQPYVGSAGTTLWLLLAAVGVVLVVGCVNVASLMLARAVKREREMALRAALGAGRGRLVRQCLTECALLGVGGGALGIAVAVIGLHPFVAWWPGGLPRAGEVTLDARALLFALAIALVASLSVGLAPALRAGREAERGGTRRGVRRAHRGLVVAEVGLALVLLGAAGMLGETMVRLTSLRLGITTDRVLTGRVALDGATLANVGSTRAAWEAMLARLRAQPQVADAAMVDTVPLRQGNNPGNYWIGATAPPEAQQPTALLNSVSTDYFQTMGIPLIAGRQFDSRDRLGSAPVVVVDETLAAHAFPGRSPEAAVGQSIHIGLSDDPHTIVGVVGHVRYWGPAGDDESPVRDQVYYAFEQLPAQYVKRWSELMSVVVKTRVAPLAAVDAVERAVTGGGGAALYRPAAMADLAHGSLDQQRFLALLFAGFSALAVLLACLGVYGVQAFLTAQRVPEIGLRMALGAERETVFWMVVKESLAMVGVGVVVGAGVALVGAGELQKLVPGMTTGVEAGTLLTIAAMGLAMLAAAALAVVPVARRASRVAPMGALRAE